MTRQGGGWGEGNPDSRLRSSMEGGPSPGWRESRGETEREGGGEQSSFDSKSLSLFLSGEAQANLLGCQRRPARMGGSPRAP